MTYGKMNAKTVAEGGSNPIHLLCRYYHKDKLIDLVKLVIEKGADVNAKDEDELLFDTTSFAM